MPERIARRLATVVEGAGLASVILGCLAVGLGLTYLSPEQFVRRSLPDGQVSIVVTVESFGPYWPVLFMTTGFLLLAALAFGRGIVAAHVVAIFAWTFYGAAILLGAVLSAPPSPIIVGVIATAIVALHMAQIRAHQDEGLT